MLKAAIKSLVFSLPPVKRLAGRAAMLESEVRALRVELEVFRANPKHSDEPYRPSLLHRPPDKLEGVTVKRSVGETVDDASIVRRVVAFYRHAVQSQADLGQSMWKTFFQEKHEDLHQLVLCGSVDEVAAVLRNPGNSELFYGFSMLCAGLYDEHASDEKLMKGARQYFDWLICLAEELGVVRIFNPERADIFDSPDADELLQKIETALDINIILPNPYPNESGLATSRGVLTDRVPMALYQAWRLKNLVKGIDDPRVVEIGAGQGLTAYYARLMGIKDYTVVDLPFTAISSGYFLMRALGEDHVAMYGDGNDSIHKIKILPPQAFMAQAERFDVALNADSLTEMDESVAHAYLEKIKTTSRLFLSINHEANSHTVRAWIAGTIGKAFSRTPSYIRKGYIEEVVRFDA